MPSTYFFSYVASGELIVQDYGALMPNDTRRAYSVSSEKKNLRLGDVSCSEQKIIIFSVSWRQWLYIVVVDDELIDNHVQKRK